MSRFDEDGSYHERVEDISESGVTVKGGGDFHDGEGFPIEKETIDYAIGLAKKYGMIITGGIGKFYGYSEYSPDPGDVVEFTWQKDDTISKEFDFDNAVTTLQGLKI